MRKLVFTFLLLSIGFLQAQSSISFYENSFEEALAVAKSEGKDVFLDTYAPWCKPCKKMDKVFRNSKVANFYNENFINVKVNVDLIKGKEIADKYEIVFLPTMLIMDANGNVKQRIDGLMEANHMIQIGNMVVNNSKPNLATVKAKEVTSAVAPSSTEVSNAAEASDTEGEKILKIIDGADLTSNPDYLYHEAFYQIGKMSGAQDSLAIKYLATQDDWSTEKNMNFIVSFVRNTDSEMFDYFVQEKDAFQMLVGAGQYRQTLEILINDCLFRQIPRPEPEKVEQLYEMLYPRKAKKYTYDYLLKRYEDEENYSNYVLVGEEYLASMIQPEAELLYKLGKYKCINADKDEVKDCVFRVEESIKLSDYPNFDQYLTLAKLYHKLGKDDKSLEMAEKAKTSSLGDTEASNIVSAFIDSLTKM